MMQLQFQLLSIVTLLLSLASVTALVNPNRAVASSKSRGRRGAVMVYSSSSSESPQEQSNGNNPCWQDIYDADCTNDSFSARFIASDWITTKQPSESSSESASESELDSSNSPCWQDIFDADCTMDSFSARFVASDWIKQLPCAQGLEECDFPEDTQLPGIRAPPVDITNVMDFLNIKRVDDTINAKKK